ncbi:MAG TPA: hypothetical protein VID24_11130 [Candidatus Eremiobacteraceae bacterium]
MRPSFAVSCTALICAFVGFAPRAGAAQPEPPALAGGARPGFHALGSKPTVNKRPGWLSQRAIVSKQLIYVADGFANQVLIYPTGDPNPSPIGALTYGVSEPEGMWVDGSGDVFVANTGNNTVEAFRHNQTTPYLVINQASPGHDYGDTVDVVADRYGNIWVSGLNGIVTEYAFGTTTPDYSITSGFNQTIAMTFDQLGFLYVTNITPFNTPGQIFQLGPGWLSGPVLPISFPSARIGGVLFDKHNNMYVADPTDSVIQIYAHGSNVPTSTITNGLLHPVFMAFDKNYNLYVQDYYNNNVTVYAYGGTSPIATISNGLMSCYGVAVWSDKY